MASICIEQELSGGGFNSYVARCTVVELDGEQRHCVYKRLGVGHSRERNALLTLRHPLIVDCDRELSARTGSLIMDYHHNGDLKNFQQHLRRAFYEDELWFIFKQLLEALCYIHEQNIVHGDINPSNILITYKGRLRLTDFGNSAVGLAQDEERPNKKRRSGNSDSHLPPEGSFQGELFGHSLDFFR